MSKETVYTEEVVSRMVEAYTSADTDEARADVVNDFAEQLGATVQSVRSKLVNLRVYKAKERKTKTGEAIESKAKIVADIAKMMDVSEEAVESLEKATKPVLKAIRSYMVDCQ